MLVRVDSNFLHSEVARPALEFLRQQGFGGPRAEYLKAHAHYRAGDMKAAVTEANNAFESTLKEDDMDGCWCVRRGDAFSLVGRGAVGYPTAVLRLCAMVVGP